MKKFRVCQKGGSAVFAIVLSLLTVAIISLLWYIFYPIENTTSTVIRAATDMSVNATLFADVLDNVWLWFGVIALFILLIWGFSYTVKGEVS